MAKIDTSKIEGYAEMTAEQKVEALEKYTFADPDYSGYVKKELYDKTASDLSKVKKELDARLSEEEKKAKAAEEELQKYKEQAETLQREKNIATNKAQLITAGYDEALAQETAEALEKCDFVTFLKNQQIVIDNVKKIAKGEANASVTTPAGKANEGNKVISKEQFNKMSYAEMAEIYQNNPELYAQLTQ